jgi:ribosome-interacting GTPase 1
MAKIKATASHEEQLRKKLAKLKEAERTARTPEEKAEAFRKMAKVRGVLSAVVRSRKYGTLIEESLISEALKDC